MSLWLALLFAAPPTPPACVDSAGELHRVGDFLLAARTAESCWDSTRNLRALLIGCQSRVRLGHFAAAARTLAVYDHHAATDPSTWSRESAEALRVTIAAHTGSLRVVIDPPLAAGERFSFELRHLGSDREPLVGGVPEFVAVGSEGLRLDGGSWSLVIHRDRFEPVRTELSVTPRSARLVTVAMRRLATPRVMQLAALPTRLQIGPPRALDRGVELRLRPLDTGADIVRTEHQEHLTLHLAPGRWQVLASAPGYAPLQTIVRSGAPIALQLQRK